MKGEGYAVFESDEATKFQFESIGKKGTIKKIVRFTKMEERFWNLAFGDANEQDFDDLSISNNQDIRKVIQTVANISHLFLETYPKRKIFISPVDEKRKSLYNFVFRHHYEELQNELVIMANSNNIWSAYNPEERADAFIVFKR